MNGSSANRLGIRILLVASMCGSFSSNVGAATALASGAPMVMESLMTQAFPRSGVTRPISNGNGRCQGKGFPVPS